jgi:hypothetical protein
LSGCQPTEATWHIVIGINPLVEAGVGIISAIMSVYLRGIDTTEIVRAVPERLAP